jgi:hypothetical protein
VTTHGLSGAAQPTIDPTARDLSVPPIDTSAGLLRSLPCVCGGFITADPDCPAIAVNVHTQTVIHQLWRGRVGIL